MRYIQWKGVKVVENKGDQFVFPTRKVRRYLPERYRRMGWALIRGGQVYTQIPRTRHKSQVLVPFSKTANRARLTKAVGYLKISLNQSSRVKKNLYHSKTVYRNELAAWKLPNPFGNNQATHTEKGEVPWSGASTRPPLLPDDCP